MFCTVKHRPILKCGKNTASMLMKTQATSSTSELRVSVRQAINTVNCADRVTTKMEVFKGAVLNIKFGPFYVFSRVFSPLPDTTTPWMRLWFSGSMKVVSEGDYCSSKYIPHNMHIPIRNSGIAAGPFCLIHKEVIEEEKN